MEKTNLLEIKNLTTEYPTQRGPVRAVHGVDLKLPAGGILGLVGESGCGKSTVLLSIMRLIRSPGRITQGEILYKGQDLSKANPRQMRQIRGKEISMIFQDPQSTLNPVFSIGEQIRETLMLHQVMSSGKGPGFLDFSRKKREKERVLEVMSEVGISSVDARYRAYPHQFSGGMLQRALTAIALVCNPALILADEPTTALDVTIQAQILDLMSQINQDHHTAIILVTHDLGVAAEFCDSIAVMYAGRIVEQGRVEQVIETPQHPYTQGLLNCRPRITPVKQPIAPIPGNVPDLVDLPPGCAFADRCQYHRPVCDGGPVPLIEAAPGQTSRCLRHVDFERQSDWTWSTLVEGGQA
jgi:oligopeptide/dipeptide ABC transporter ATP-binding protein